MKSYTIHCLSTALSPITHMQGVVGNEAIVAREKIETESGLRFIPVLSGNAIRHRAIREPGMMWLIDRYGLKPTLKQLNFLLHGGALTESTQGENTARIAEMKRTWPLLRLCGGSLSDQILTGSLDCWRGMLICEENRHSLDLILQSPINGHRLLPAERFCADYQYTRGDAAKLAMAVDDEIKDETNLMIYGGQCVSRGAVFHHGFVLKHVGEVELGALLWSLRLWQSEGGTIGGQASKGHGRLCCEIVFDGDQDSLCSAYIDYAMSVKEDAIAWLNNAFDERPKKKKGKKDAAQGDGDAE